MIGIQHNNELLEMQPGSIIQRERNSPFWLTTTTSGKDGIPGEYTNPVAFPLTPANRRRLGFVGTIPVQRQRQFDVKLMHDVYQVSTGKLIMLNTKMNLNNPDKSIQEGYILHNSSQFFKEVEGKKLSSLMLGGERVFAWDGFNVEGTGFWAMAHNTWKYKSEADGHFVFFPIAAPEYKGYAEMINKVYVDKLSKMRLSKDNVTSLCPHIFYSYILRQIFIENGYTVDGDIFNDEGFAQMCLASMVGVAWSTIGEPTDDILPVLPKTNITINLSEHLPPNTTIAEFIVELCKFLPLGFEFNDNTRHCSIKILGQTAAKVKDWTKNISADVELPQADSGKDLKRYAMDRQFSDSNQYNQFIPSDYSGSDPNIVVYLQPWTNHWVVNGFYDEWGEWIIHPFPLQLASNIASYKPDGATDSITCSLTPLPDAAALIENEPSKSNMEYSMPYIECEGNWAGKPEMSDWGLRVTFFKGMRNGGVFATSNGGTYVNSGGQNVYLGGWSMAFYNGTKYDMLSKWWRAWLDILEQEDGMNGICYMPLLEYMQFNWSDVIQIQNTNYLIRKIADIFPYPGWFQFEAVRISR
jgi:hypothetical protein